MNIISIHYVTKTTIFSCFYSVGPVCPCLGFLSSYFPQFLLCHTFYSYFQKEEEIAWSLQTLDFCSASNTSQAMQHQETRISDGNIQNEEDSKSNQYKEATDLMKKVSHSLKHNIGSFSKKFRIKKKIDKISISSNIPAQLVYILLNSPEPLQIKINEILSRFQNQMKNKLKICTNTTDLSKYEPLESPEDDSENEEDTDEEYYYIPIMLNHKTAVSIPNVTGGKSLEGRQT